jgi:hypothetical protein
MAVEICGFEDLSGRAADLLAFKKAQGEAAFKARTAVQIQQTAAAAGLPGIPGGIPTSVGGAARTGVRLGVQEGKKLMEGELAKMGVPPVLAFIPSDLTPEGIKDAAYSVAKTYAEKSLQSATGFPIKLPTKLTAKAIGRSVGALIPTDLEGVIDTGLAIGAQAAASAVTSLLVGAGIGSVIPGLGTIVGIGAALGVAALKGLVKGEPPKYLQKCKTKMYGGCPRPPALSALELLPWVDQRYHQAIARELRAERDRTGCGAGETVTCLARLSTLRADAYHIAKTTPQVLGLPQLNRLIPLYERIDGIQTYQPADDVALILTAMKNRRALLQTLLVDPSRLTGSQIVTLRWNLVTELNNAMVQMQYQPGPETTQWLGTLIRLYNGLQQREIALQQAQAAQQAAGRKLGAERMKDPAAVAAHERQILQLRCSDGDQTACAQFRSSPGAPAPRLPQAPPRTAPQNPWKAWLRVARSDQLARRPVTPPPAIPPQNLPGLPPAWSAWLNAARGAQQQRRPVPFPPAIPQAWAA